MNKIMILFLVALLFFNNGCAPGLGTSIEVSTLPEITEPSEDEALRTVKVNVRTFTDARARTSSIKVNDRAVEVSGELGAVVQAGFEEAIRKSGGALCLFDCTAITGEITRWDMKVLPVFPVSKVEAQASIKVTVVSKDGKASFSGNYSGKMSGEHPYYSEDRLLNAFGMAMNEAIQSALSDHRLVDELNRLGS